MITKIQEKMADISWLLKEILNPSNERSDEQPDTTDMPQLESEESAAERRIKQGKGLKILTPDQMLSRLPITLGQLNAGNNSQKLLNEIRQLLYSLYRWKKINQNNLQTFNLRYLKMEANFMNTKNRKTNEPHRFRLSLADKNNLKNPNKKIPLGNLNFYYTWKNIKSAYSNNKFKMFARTWNNTFDFPDGSYSIADIQDYFQFVIKEHKTLTENTPVQIYPNKIKNGIVFKIKTGYKLELLSPKRWNYWEVPKNMLIKIKLEKI